MALTTPTVHLNGTSRDSLVSGYFDAWRALGVAIEATRATAPHGRDYYVQDSNALVAATKEFYSRMERLASVRAELEEIIDLLQK